MQFLSRVRRGTGSAFVYIAPAGSIFDKKYALNNGGTWCPAVDLTMLSMQKKADSIMGIVLTGMGRDGADDIYFLHIGAITLPGPLTPIKSMPQAAIELEVDFILTQEKLSMLSFSFNTIPVHL